MKSLTILLFIGALTATGYGQSNLFVNAKIAFEERRIEDAKMNIDKVDPVSKTAKQAKFWKLKGDIYVAHYKQQDGGIKTRETLNEVLGFYSKCKELDNSKTFTKEIERDWGISQNMFLNSGVQLYNETKYGEAYTVFVMTIDVAEFLGTVDTLAIYNAGLAADRNKKYRDAIKWYGKCVEMNYRGELCCASNVHMYRQLGDEEGMRSTLESCRSKYPDDENLLITAINTALMNGEYQKAAELMEKSLMRDPSNATMHYILGTAYDALKEYDKAERSFIKAIELDPGYFEAYFNLGAIYFNQANELKRNAFDETDPDKYLVLQNEVQAAFKKTVSPFEKAHQIKPDDVQTLQTLKQLYISLDDSDKYTEINEKLKALGL